MVMQKAFMVLCACVFIYAHKYGCIHVCTHMFSARELWGEVSYNHTQIWIMSVARSIGMMSFFITFKTVTYSYPGASGEWFGMLILHRGKLRLALSHGARWWKTRTGLPTLWPSVFNSTSSCSEYPVLGKKGHLRDLPGKAPSQYKLSMSIVHSKAGNI